MAGQNLKERRSKFKCNACRFFIQIYITVNDHSVLVTFCLFDQKGWNFHLTPKTLDLVVHVVFVHSS